MIDIWYIPFLLTAKSWINKSKKNKTNIPLQNLMQLSTFINKYGLQFRVKEFHPLSTLHALHKKQTIKK